MKSVLSLLPCLLALHCLAQSQTASVTAYCRSLILYSATAYSGSYSFQFTTADDSSGWPQFVPVTGGMPIFSNELRPSSTESKVYESDYEMLSGINPAQYGALSLTFPGGDTNHNSIPDVFDPAAPMYCLVPGTGHSSWASSNYFTMSLRFNRAAGSTTGTFSGNWTFGGGNYTMSGSLRLMLLQGSTSYTRGRTNQLQFQLVRTNPDGLTTNTLTGTTVYTASANQISLPRSNLTDNRGRIYTTRPAVLSRHGNRYLGNLRFVDGAPETPWPDYLDWILTITDTNDTDNNGIPDISDPSAVHIPSAPLIVTTSGQGTVSPALSGRNLELGKSYRLTAVSATGYSFSGWTGDIVSSSRVLLFTMQTNLTLQANFVPNPFYPLRGTYYGLLEDTNNPSNQTLGSFTATSTEGGTYSAKFQLGGQTFSVSGGFDASGSTYPVIVPQNLRPLFVQLHLDLTNSSGLSGSIGDGVWVASIKANKSPFRASSNPCAFAGKYTFAIPYYGVLLDTNTLPGVSFPSLSRQTLPVGHSYGTVRVDAAGHLHSSLWLGDGTRATQTTMMSGTGDWPFYMSLYGGKGCLAGWLTFTNLTGQSNAYGTPLSGVPVWVKPAATTKYAPEGFTNRLLMMMAEYAAPRSGMPTTGWTNGIISFRGGDLEAPFMEEVAVGSHNKLASTSTNKLSLRVLANGLFQGRVTPPDGTRPVSFHGAFLQRMGSGFGHWLEASQSGAVDFGPLLGVPGQPPSLRTNLPIPGIPVLPPYTNTTGVILQRRPPLPPLSTNIITQPLTNVQVIIITNTLPPIQLNTNPLVPIQLNTNPLPPIQLNTNPLVPIYPSIPGYTSGSGAVIDGGASATLIRAGSWQQYQSARTSLQRTTLPVAGP